MVTSYFGITEEEDDSEEDEHTVASGGSFLEPKKSKVKQEMEKLKKVQKDKKNESQRKEKKLPKSKAANVKVEKDDEDEVGNIQYVIFWNVGNNRTLHSSHSHLTGFKVIYFCLMPHTVISVSVCR